MEHRIDERSLENLRPPWKPGESGNPGGRPKREPLDAQLRAALEAVEAGGKPLAGGKRVRDAIADVVLERALEGDIRFIRELFDRAYGLPKQTIDVNAAVKGYAVGNSPDDL